jgi:hypothetical protein
LVARLVIPWPRARTALKTGRVVPDYTASYAGGEKSKIAA